MDLVRFMVVAFDGVDELDVVGPLAVLRRAARVKPYLHATLVVLGPDIAFTSHQGVRMVAESLLTSDADVLVVPGGGWASGTPTGVRAEIERGVLPRRIASMHARGTVVASVCTGALILGAAGIAKGRRMTTHHVAYDALAAQGVLVVRDRVVDDGTIISAGGVTSGIDLGLYLVKRYADAKLSQEIAEALEWPYHEWGEPAESVS